MNNLAVIIILSTTALLFIAGMLEKIAHQRALHKIPIRILVNGTRGKTSVTRLIAAILREDGIRTWAKTTGTQAAWILPDGSEIEYRKNKPVNIREQIPFFRRAATDGAQAVVVECMALHPENQRMMAEELVQPTLVVLTNARVDHISEIGKTVEETAQTLALSVPNGAQVIADDACFDPYVSNRLSAQSEEVDADYVNAFAYPMFEDNVRQALCVARLLKISRDTALKGMHRARPDAGMCGPFHVNNCTIINAFAANDPESTQALLEKSLHDNALEDAPIWVLFNNRGDREFRLREFSPLMQQLAKKNAQIRIVGEHTAAVAHYFSRHAQVSARQLEKPPIAWFEELGKTHCAVLCMGNIHGMGREIVDALMMRETQKYSLKH